MGLLHRDFEAIGNLVKFPLSNELEQIPFFIFGEDPEIAWNSSSISAGGRKYNSIRVLRSQKVDVAGTPRRLAQQHKMGRPSVAGLLEGIVQELYEKGRLKGLLRKEQESLIREMARTKYPDVFRRETHPSKPTIIKALLTMFRDQDRKK